MKRERQRILDQNVTKLIADLCENKFNVIETDKVPISNFCHIAVQKLVESNLVRGVITENVDHMHVKAGIDQQFVLEKNSNLYEFQCLSCNSQYRKDLGTGRKVCKNSSKCMETSITTN